MGAPPPLFPSLGSEPCAACVSWRPGIHCSRGFVWFSGWFRRGGKSSARCFILSPEKASRSPGGCGGLGLVSPARRLCSVHVPSEPLSRALCEGQEVTFQGAHAAGLRLMGGAAHPHLLSWRPPVWALTGVLPRRRASPGCCQVPCTPSQGAPTSRRSWGGSAPRRGFALRNVLSSPRAGTPPRPAALLVTPLSFGVLPLYLLGFVMAPLRHPSRGPSCTLRVSARRPSWALLTALLSDRRLPLCSRATLPLSLICPPGW